ncbi:MAG: DMT family transporter [Rhodobacteraceae bacterium]|nr:DMT family transporter [Paracoccaceae bacterium]
MGLAPIAMLFATGAAWGLTLPLIRVAVSTGHQPLGIVLWQKVIMAAMLGALSWAMRLHRPFATRQLGLFAGVAVFGAILPGYFSYLTAAELPAGVRAIILAIVPMFALPMALALGFERPQARRALGVVLGAAAITAIALPGAGPSRIELGIIALALIAPLSYAIEASFLAWRGSDGLHPFQLLLGASLVGIVLTWPLAAATGQTVDLGRAWGAAEWAILASGVLNALAYSGYVWLVSCAGSVFASQIAYLVTGFGVLWSMLLLGERYSLWVWLGCGLMLAGVALIQPLKKKAVIPEPV